jgi:poly(hydroxyalkanoate) granule-associated protein
MVSKTLKKKVPAKQAQRVFEVPVVDSAKDIFFAGLGVFSVAQQEGEKLIGQGTRLFDKLVSEGARLEKKSLHFAENAVSEIKTDVEKRLEGVRQQANENWDQLGNMFDERVPAALERLGIPTSRDLDRLSGRMKDMSAKATNNLKGFEKLARDASNNLSKLEKEFTKRVKVALESLQVPSMDALNKLSESVKKASRDSADNLGKLETMIEQRVASVFGKLEASTAKELKKLNADMADVSRQVTDNFGKLENVVEKRVRVILDGLGIPGSNDFSKLATELNKLSMKVSELDKQLKDNAKTVAAKSEKSLAPKAATGMTVAERKKAAEAISMMKPANKPETAGK